MATKKATKTYTYEELTDADARYNAEMNVLALYLAADFTEDAECWMEDMPGLDCEIDWRFGDYDSFFSISGRFSPADLHGAAERVRGKGYKNAAFTESEEDGWRTLRDAALGDDVMGDVEIGAGYGFRTGNRDFAENICESDFEEWYREIMYDADRTLEEDEGGEAAEAARALKRNSIEVWAFLRKCGKLLREFCEEWYKTGTRCFAGEGMTPGVYGKLCGEMELAFYGDGTIADRNGAAA